MTKLALAAGINRHRRRRCADILMGMALTLLVSAAAQAQTDGGTSTLSLEPLGSSLSLDTITVTSSTASGYAVDVQNAPASVSVVTHEELEGKAYRDVREALRNIPGLYLNASSTGKGGTHEISLRGMDPKYTLLLVNGIPQGIDQAFYNGYGRGAEYGWLPPVTAIERIEVIRGPMSTLYGSAALGGVINIITKPVANEWSGAVSAGVVVQEDSDSGNQYQTGFRVSGPIIQDTLSLRLNADVLQRKEDEIKSGYAGYLQRNINAGLDWAISDDNVLTFEAGFGRQDTHAGANASSSRDNDMDLRTERTRQTVRHKLDWGERWTTTSYIQREEVSIDSGPQSTYERITANTQTVLPFSDHLFTVGVQYRQQHIDHDASRAQGAETLERDDGALYAEHQWFMTQDFTLTWGLRYVYDEFYGGELVPRAYGSYKLTSELTLKGGVSAGYRTPNLKEGDSNWIEGGGGPNCAGCRDVGNSDLKPEKSTTYELGLYYQTIAGIRSSLTFFHTDFTNKIEKPIVCGTWSDSTTAPTPCLYNDDYYTAIYQYTNVAEAEVNGIEFTLAAPLTHNLDVSTSYTFTDSEQTAGENEGQPLNNQPEHQATLGLEWQINEGTQLWSQARYQGRTQETCCGRGSDPSYPSYVMVDLGASHEFDSGLALFGGIYNILNRKITYEDYGRVVDGRRYNIGVRYSF